jgi:sigma-E factor negative regulatory protein RseB
MFMVALLSLWSPASLAQGAGAADEQLQRMASALRSLSYEGTLVYSHDGRLETLRIVHRIDDGRVHERLESLNGPLRTMTRVQDQVTCHLSDARPISVRDQGLGTDLLRSRAIDPAALASNYLIHHLGSARVAARQTEVVGIIPRDRMRYGYRFFIDQETGLPLKFDLMDSEHKAIEQIMFTALELHAEQPPPSPARSAEAGDPAPPAPPSLGPWRLDPLPAGFEVVMVDHWTDDEDDRVEHFVLSDGLASISVYVENGDQEGLSGGSRIGAVHAVGGVVEGHQVTVVGEVPAQTVEAVLAAVSLAEADAQ